ncbi:MAG: hypothetical protein HKN46_01355 [Acidimicrobiia bacterium]|nr:hypothetical protein [Acidimicrobiia bacterium]
METTPIHGPTVQLGERTVRLVGADTSVSAAIGPAGVFGQWARPRQVEVTTASGSTEIIPVPDITFIVRAVALVLLALLTLTKGLHR